MPATLLIQTFAIVLATLASTTAALSAEPPDCSTFRLDDPGGSMANINVHDQDGVGICYAFTAADMVNAALAALHPEHPVAAISPLAGAILASQKVHRKVKTNSEGLLEFPFEDDDECTVVNHIREHGYCDDAVVTSRLGPTTYETNARIYKPFKNHTNSLPDAASKIACELRDSLPGALSPSLAQIKLAITTSTPLTYFKAVAHEACPKPVQAKIPPCVELKTKDAQQVHQIMVEHFKDITLQTLPVAIGYCSGVLTEGPGFSGIVKAMRGNPLREARVCEGYEPGDVDDDGGHSSLIIGRRINSKTGHCQLLVKNSWGTSRNAYAADWDADGGKIWVDQEALERNIFDVSAL